MMCVILDDERVPSRLKFLRARFVVPGREFGDKNRPRTELGENKIARFQEKGIEDRSKNQK